ncbi:MAG: hypothetical protein OEP48_06675 [Betaproteobacteria bacterium]|nr:hypothetical protein [Betaproteobacteria bacterium]MDH3436147.1 hypothetical protein [Betaproteobacteria bacterium]
MNFDTRGRPGVSVVTQAFTDAVEKQSGALGFDPGVVYVPHPIQNRTPEELAKIADDAVGPVLALLQHSGKKA